MTKIRQKQAKLTLSPSFFQVSVRKINHQNRDSEKERNRVFYTNKNELNPFTYFYRDHVFFIVFSEHNGYTQSTELNENLVLKSIQ